ncbi:MAG: dihydrofolate reductase family protein [Bacteroidota bacterium]
MKPTNHIFIATSLDGYIADKNGGIDFLDTFPEINTIDSGYAAFTADIDALVMGRTTFETVCSFGIDWPYEKPVFVLSTTLDSIPEKYNGKAHLVRGAPAEILDQIHQQGYKRLYIDGGATIQSFLKADLIDSMVITIIPVLLGDGVPLFGELPNPLKFECFESKVYLNKIVQNHFRRVR